MCILTSGRAIGCKKSGGINNLYFAPWAKRDYVFSGEVVLGTDAADGAALTFETIELLPETGSGDQPISSPAGTGASKLAHTVVARIANTGKRNVDDELRTLTDTLARGRWLVLHEDNNGVYRLYGAKAGMCLTDGSIAIGKEADAVNGATMTFVSNGEPKAARVVDLAGDGAGSTVEFVINNAPV